MIKTASLILFILTILSISFTTPLDKATSINLSCQNLSPTLAHFFGTDDIGRDIFARCFYALKISLTVGILATLIDMLLGSLFGILAALLPSPYCHIINRFLDVMTILPQMLLSILILMMIKHGLVSLIIAISLTGWLPTARAIRLEMLKLKTMDFIKALQGLGFSKKAILFKHLLPTSLPTLFVSSALCLPQAIFSEAFMSFLGLGVNPPTPSLGNMISDGLSALSYFPWRLLFPAGFVFSLILLLHHSIDQLKKKLKVLA